MLRTNEYDLEKLPFALAEELLREAGEMRFVALGASMLPAIYPGDELIVRRARLRDIRVGDVVLFAQHGRWFAHRVKQILPAATQPCLVTQGDALGQQDAPVFTEEVLGHISFLVRNGEQRIVSPVRSRLQNVLRAAVRHIPFFAGFCLRWQRIRSRLANLRRSAGALARSQSSEPV